MAKTSDLKTVAWHAPAPRWRRNPPLGFLRPSESTLVARPPAGPGWLHEIKHDGFRILARKQGERVSVWSRRGADFTYRFPAIAEAVRGQSADKALIDGEAVVLRNDERSDFLALLTKRGGVQASLVAFDIVRLNGDDLRLRSLSPAGGAPTAGRREARRRYRNSTRRSPRRRDRVRQSLRARP
jgi:bifunctional non-homologous end joining protein LigD